MYTPFMQHAATVGLFMGVWNSMVDTKVYDAMDRVTQADKGKEATFELNERAAKWRTIMNHRFAVSWDVVFKDGSLGAWSVAMPRGGGIDCMLWHPESTRAGEEPKAGLDDETFIRMFETLRRSAAAYIRHYGFSVDLSKDLIRGIVAP